MCSRGRMEFTMVHLAFDLPAIAAKVWQAVTMPVAAYVSRRRRRSPFFGVGSKGGPTPKNGGQRRWRAFPDLSRFLRRTLEPEEVGEGSGCLDCVRSFHVATPQPSRMCCILGRTIRFVGLFFRSSNQAVG